jgi:hypothetical protein
MRNRNTIEFLGIRESLNNPHFKPLDFEGFNQGERLKRLNGIAIRQMQVLTAEPVLKQLKG